MICICGIEKEKHIFNPELDAYFGYELNGCEAYEERTDAECYHDIDE